MRKQYHSKIVEGRRLIWDVDNLIVKSKNLTVIEIELSGIKELGQNYWYQGESDNPTCKSIAKHMKLAQECDLNFPIILASDGSVMDGMHRVCKAYLNGQESIKAVKFEATPKPDFIDIPLKELPYGR